MTSGQRDFRARTTRVEGSRYGKELALLAMTFMWACGGRTLDDVPVEDAGAGTSATGTFGSTPCGTSTCSGGRVCCG
jgi:hypothetical protein